MSSLAPGASKQKFTILISGDCLAPDTDDPVRSTPQPEEAGTVIYSMASTQEQTASGRLKQSPGSCSPSGGGVGTGTEQCPGPARSATRLGLFLRTAAGGGRGAPSDTGQEPGRREDGDPHVRRAPRLRAAAQSGRPGIPARHGGRAQKFRCAMRSRK